MGEEVDLPGNCYNLHLRPCRGAPRLMGVDAPMPPEAAPQCLLSSGSGFCHHCKHLRLKANAVSQLLSLRHSCCMLPLWSFTQYNGPRLPTIWRLHYEEGT